MKTSITMLVALFGTLYFVHLQSDRSDLLHTPTLSPNATHYVMQNDEGKLLNAQEFQSLIADMNSKLKVENRLVVTELHGLNRQMTP